MPASEAIPAETRKILGLAWPVVLTSLNWTLLHVTDVAVVGLVGTEQVAILGASRTLSYIAIVAGLSALAGILVFVSRADGARDLPATGQVLREGLLLSVVIGLIAAGALYLGAPVMLAGFGVAPPLIPATTAVVRIMAIGFPLQLVMIGASYFLEGISRPQRVMAVNLSILPINAVLAWALSGGHLGLPAWGAAGAAGATSIASAIGAVAMLASVWTLPRASERGVRDMRRMAWSGVPGGAWRLAKFGVIPSLASGLELAGFSILIALSTRLGDATAHAFQIVFSIHNLTFAFALGLGSAAGVRAGNAVGEGRPAAAISRTLIAVVLAAGLTGLLAILVIVAASPIVGIFPSAAAVQLMAVALLPIWAPFILFDGVQVVLVYALRSLGDQVAAGINSILAFFVVTGGLGWWLVHVGAGAGGLAIASGVGMLAATILHGSRFVVISRRVRRKS